MNKHEPVKWFEFTYLVGFEESDTQGDVDKAFDEGYIHIGNWAESVDAVMSEKDVK